MQSLVRGEQPGVVARDRSVDGRLRDSWFVAAGMIIAALPLVRGSNPVPVSSILPASRAVKRAAEAADEAYGVPTTPSPLIT